MAIVEETSIVMKREFRVEFELPCHNSRTSSSHTQTGIAQGIVVEIQGEISFGLCSRLDGWRTEITFWMRDLTFLKSCLATSS